MNILFAILSLLDVFAGLTIFAHGSLFFNRFVFYITLFCLIKGGWSIISSLAARYYFDWMGAVDIIAGISLFTFSSGTSSELFSFIGIVVILKGAYSFIRSVL